MSSSPCAACKFLRRKCTPECIFSGHFPADDPKRFAVVHKVFGASNVAKLLQEIDSSHHEEAVKSLAYEANARIEDPVYGCIRQISEMQRRLGGLQMSLEESKKMLASFVGPNAVLQMLQSPHLHAQHHPFSSAMLGLDRQQEHYQRHQQQVGAHIMQQCLQRSQLQHQLLQQQQQQQQQQHEREMQVREQQKQLHEGGLAAIRDAADAQLQQIDSQEAAALQAREEYEMFRSYEEMHRQAQMEVMQQQQEAELMRLHQQQIRHMEAKGGAGPSGTAELSPILALGSKFDAMNPYHVQQQEQLQLSMLQQAQQPQLQQQQEIQDIQLFSDHNIHPPEPENCG